MHILQPHTDPQLNFTFDMRRLKIVLIKIYFWLVKKETILLYSLISNIKLLQKCDYKKTK